ncbi:MAG: hypothetical protein OXG71_12445, partial [Rhodospirillales bacterium]|nr:hypothetical protein [Rhodospirillales bacterium]
MFPRITREAVAVAYLLFVVALPAGADFEAGQRQLDAGDPAAAIASWRTAAAAGDAGAMLGLGRLYQQGLGVLQDYVEAHKWFNLAASLGDVDGVRERDALAEKMTPQQVAAAQERAAAWQPEAVAAAGEMPAQVAGSEPDTPSPVDPDAPVTPLPPSEEDIREAQALLGTLGYGPGPADGKWGARSTQAYRAFLRDASMPAADSLSHKALQALREEAARREEPQATAAAADSGPASGERTGTGTLQQSTGTSVGETVAAVAGFVIQGIYAAQLVELIETPEDFARIAPELQELLTQMFSGLGASDLAVSADADIALGVLTEMEQNRLSELLEKDRELPAETRAALSEALASAGVSGETESSGPNWIMAENQPCRLYNPNPMPDETVTWSGGCVDGKAHGEGRREWRTPKGVSVYVGPLRAGTPHGRGVLTGAGGNHYEGDFVDGELAGQGVFTWPDGDRYEGDFVDGKPHG